MADEVKRETRITNECKGKKLSELNDEALGVLGLLKRDGRRVSGGEVHTACSCVGVEDRTDNAKRRNLWEFPPKPNGGIPE